MSSGILSFSIENILSSKDDKDLVPSFTEKEPETFEPLSINIFSYGEKKDSIGEINSYYNQVLDTKPMPSLKAIKNIFTPKKPFKICKSTPLGINNESLPAEEEKCFLKKRCKERRRRRKENNDNIRIKIKRNFLNKYLKKRLNNILQMDGIKEYFDFFPNKFSRDISKGRNSMILDLTLREIFLDKELYLFEDEEGNSKYEHNFNMIQSDEIKNNEKLQKILNKTIRELYAEYLDSDEFNIDEINRLKNVKKEDDYYIKKYKIISKSLINFFAQ